MHKPKGCATRCPKASDPHDFPALVDKPVPGVAVMVEDTRTNIISLGHVTHAIAPGPPCSRTHRCRSWCRASWPAQAPWRPMRRSTGEPAAPVSQARPALPPRCPIRIQPAVTAILHGLARRTAPQAPCTAPGAERAGGRQGAEPPFVGYVRFAPDFVGSPPSFGRGRHPRRTSQPDPFRTLQWMMRWCGRRRGHGQMGQGYCRVQLGEKRVWAVASAAS